MLSRKLASMLMFVVVSTATIFTVDGQTNFDELIEKESTAFVVVQRPSEILAYLGSTGFFENENLLAARRILVDDRFSLTSEVRIEKFLKELSVLQEILEEVDQISIVIHRLGKNDQDKQSQFVVPDFSIIFSAEAKLVSELEAIGKTILNYPKFSSKLDDADYLTNTLKNSLEGLELINNGDSIILSNAPAIARDIVSRGSETKPANFRSLARNRSYQSVQAVLNKRNGASAITGYINPSHSAKLITGLIDEMFAKFPANSLAGAGFRISLNENTQLLETSEGEFKGGIEFDAVVRYVNPPTGFGELIEALQPIGKLPTKPFNITRLYAFGFNGPKRSNARQKLYEEKTRPIPWERMVMRSFQGSELSADTVLGHAKTEIQLYHFPKNGDFPRFLSIKTPDDYLKMNKVFSHTIKDENRNNRKTIHFKEIECDHGIHFARDESAIRRRMQLARLDDSEQEDNLPISDSVMARQREYFLNEEWMVYADHFSLAQFIEGMYEQPATDKKFDILYRDAADDSKNRNFVKVVYESSSWNMVKAGSIEAYYIMERYKSDQKKQQEISKTIPDENGLRIPLATKQDAKVAVQILVARSLAEAFGTSIQLYSKGENRLELYGKVYSQVK